MPRRVFITVADVSGDRHAAELIRSLRRLDPEIIAEGHGGPAMRAAGAIIHTETVAGAAMGLHGVKRAGQVFKMLKWTAGHYEQARPDLHVCIDSSAMNIPFAKVAKAQGVPVLYYIAPQLWASREYRIKKLRARVDHVACILPFEEDWYRQRGVNATYVGHPLFDELPADRMPAIEQARAQGLSIPARPPIVGIIPGSRKAEIGANLPHLLDVAGHIRRAFPGVSFLIPTTAGTHSLVTHMASGIGDVVIQQDAFDTLIPQCDLCLCKSGTATLHVAAYYVPMIVVYRCGLALWLLASCFLNTRKIALVNILAGNVDLVPEIIPWRGSNVPVAELAIDYLKNPAKLANQRKKLRQLVNTLDNPGASMNTAKIAMDMMDRRMLGNGAANEVNMQ